MPTLWIAIPSLDGAQHLQDLKDAHPPGFEFVNQGEVHVFRMNLAEREYPHHGDAEVEPLAFNGMPTPSFRIADRQFALDYFNVGVTCASSRLRRVLGLGGDVVRYRDVDLGSSPLEVRARGYQVMQVVAFADPFDRDRTSGGTAEIVRPDGSTRREWRLAQPDPYGPPLHIHWRDDFVPPAPLFRVPGTPWTLATDALAAVVMKAGVTDVVFQDVVSDRSRQEIVLRQ
jgi:hypothetical protein